MAKRSTDKQAERPWWHHDTKPRHGHGILAERPADHGILSTPPPDGAFSG